ncbi:MAG: SDR family NAD(P)-dependent oxidoreductase, partial [Myxococcota bacterium]
MIFDGKVVVITGAGSGIGRAAARLFVAEGAKVVVAEIDAALGEASAREAGADARFVRTDYYAVVVRFAGAAFNWAQIVAFAVALVLTAGLFAFMR